MRILVVDDEPSILKSLTTQLEARGHQVHAASSGEQGLLLAGEIQPELVLLDVGLPDLSGIEVCYRLREWSRVPVIFLTVHDEERMKVRALDSGGDDYITKPFSTAELLARIRAVVRRTQDQPGSETSIFESGDLKIDFIARRVTVADEEVRLTPTEYQLLRYFALHAGKTLTHQDVLVHVWGPQSARSTQYLHVFMRQLRRKLERDPRSPRHFVTEPGIGYRLRSEKPGLRAG